MKDERRNELHELARSLTRETLHGAPPVATTRNLASGIIELLVGPEKKWSDEELLDQYVNGNLELVREELMTRRPLDAAAAALTLYKALQENDDVLEFSEGTAELFMSRLYGWSWA